ncbi:MAG: MFS transporter [Chloroflexi bacterium]|nr:MFS transporter [Chloroflexota bacterium]
MSETGRWARAAVLAVAAGNFMIFLGMMPVSVALPTIAGVFGIDAATAAWIMNAYLLTLTGLVLTTGRLGDLYGYRRIYLLGIAIFTLGALAAGLAPSFAALVAARAVQGIGGALMMGTALAIIVALVPERQRGTAIGLAAVAASFGSLVGVVLGSFLLELITWRAVLLAAAPAGILAYLVARRLPADPVRAGPIARPDLVGAALLFALLTTLSLSFSHLHEGAATFEAGAVYHTGMQLLTGALLAAFIVVESRAKAPMMPLGLFRHRRFTMAILANLTLHMTMMGSIFLVPFLVEQGLGRSAATTGALLAPMQIAGMAASFFGGWLYDRTRSRLIAPAMLGIIGVGMGLLGLRGATMGDLSMGLLLVGVGLATNIFQSANNTAAMSALPARLSGFASGMLETSRQLGHTIAVALAAGVLGLVAEQARAGASGQANALQGVTLAILSFSLVAFVGIIFALFGGERRQPASPVAAVPTPAVIAD